MISLPTVSEISSLTIFPDDEDDAHFYYLPRNPRIALDEGGKPEFTFLYYQNPLNRPDSSEPGGGYLTFTTDMKEDPRLLADAAKTLADIYRSKHPDAVTVPQMTLSPVDFTTGEVHLITIKDQKLVKDVTLGRPSLFGDNTASVAVELPADGATLFYQALKQGASIGAIEYDLAFPVRLPAVTILGHVDSKEVKSAVIGYTREQVSSSDTWGNDESHEVAHRTSISEAMESQGLIKLEILKGNVNLSADDLESLRAFAFKAMDDFIKQHFLQGGDVASAEDRTNQWMSFIGENVTARFDIDVSYRDVINRSYNPSAQVNPTFLGGKIDDVVFLIDLQNAPWYFNTLEVTVDTNLDFNTYGDLVHSVVGHLSYDQRSSDGTHVVQRESMLFTSTDHAPKRFKTRIADVGKDSYHVDVEVNYTSGPVLQTTLARFDTTTRNLTLDVPNPGVMDVVFSAEPTGFDDKLQSIEVEVNYGDAEHQVPDLTETIILNKGTPSVPYHRVIYAPWTQPFRYRPTYVFKDDASTIHRSTADWIVSAGTLGQKQYATIHSAFDETFSLNIIASADWSQTQEVLVDLVYDDDASDYHMAGSKSFTQQSTKASAVQKWQFPLRNPKQRSYRYSQKWFMTNSAVVEKGWLTGASDAQSLVVGDAPGGVVLLQVDPSDIDFAQVRRVVVHARYADPPNDVLEIESLVFKDKTPQSWSIARADARVVAYTYDVDYFMNDGTRRTLAGQAGQISGEARDFLFLPTPPAG